MSWNPSTLYGGRHVTSQAPTVRLGGRASVTTAAGGGFPVLHTFLLLVPPIAAGSRQHPPSWGAGWTGSSRS